MAADDDGHDGPAVIPLALAHDSVARSRGESAGSAAAFVAGFLALWSLIGCVYAAWSSGLHVERFYGQA